MQAVFGQYGIVNEAPISPTPSAFGAMASFLVPKLGVGLSSGLSQEKSTASLEQAKNLRKERHAVRPPVQHNWSIPESYTEAKRPQIFQHELLQNFSINMFCKVIITFLVILYNILICVFGVMAFLGVVLSERVGRA